MWQPPENPDPREILSEARGDDPPEIALEKFLWFHKNAGSEQFLQFGYFGVRLSFALRDWLDLASEYAPAMDAYLQVRDETETAFRADSENLLLFHEVVRMNEHIDSGERTAKLFSEVAANDHAVAQRIYDQAEPVLIEVGDYRACAPFLDPDARSALAVKHYKKDRQREQTLSFFDIQHLPAARRIYIKNVATLTALLVLNDRTSDARGVYSKALLILDDEEFRTTMEAALNGHFPKECERAEP